MAKKDDISSGSGKDKNADKNTIGRRMRRYARVSTTAGGLAARLAGQKYFGIDIERDKHARQLVESLGDLKGPLLKVAQLLATIPEALPKEYAAELQQLQSDAPPMGWPFVKRRMMTELGRGWEQKFKSFDKTAAAAASLGQVHKAVLPDDRVVACKLQYPDMGSAVQADLSQLKLVLSMFEKYDKSISTRHIYDEITARLYEELDYDLEARHCKLYAHMLRNEKQVHVPDVIDDLSTDRLLTATWLQGDKVLKYVDADSETRSQIALNLFRAWYVPLYYYGVIHGDPHLGNYAVTQDKHINLLDFGCVRVFPPRFIEGVITLYHALMEQDDDKAAYAYGLWGFEGIDKHLLDVLNTWARFLYGPILDDSVRPIGEVESGKIYGRDIAHQVHQELKKAGGVKVPREFVFMDRAALGLGSVFLHLRAEVNWHQLFNEMIADFDPAKMEALQKKTLKQFNVPLSE